MLPPLNLRPSYGAHRSTRRTGPASLRHPACGNRRSARAQPCPRARYLRAFTDPLRFARGPRAQPHIPSALARSSCRGKASSTRSPLLMTIRSAWSRQNRLFTPRAEKITSLAGNPTPIRPRSGLRMMSAGVRVAISSPPFIRSSV
jgi:hypothetical protein